MSSDTRGAAALASRMTFSSEENEQLITFLLEGAVRVSSIDEAVRYRAPFLASRTVPPPVYFLDGQWRRLTSQGLLETIPRPLLWEVGSNPVVVESIERLREG